MRSQLDRLQTIIGVPNIQFGVIQLNRILETAPQNSFQIYDNIAVVETFIGEIWPKLYKIELDRSFDTAVTSGNGRPSACENPILFN